MIQNIFERMNIQSLLSFYTHICILSIVQGLSEVTNLETIVLPIYSS